MIGGQFISTLVKHLVVADVTLDTHLTTNQVVDQYLLTSLNLEANHILMPRSYQPLDLFLGKSQRVTHLASCMTVILEILNLTTFLFQFFWCIEGDICLAGIQQLLDILLINVTTFTLAIRTFVATKGNTLVELNTQPLKRLYDILLSSWHKTVGVCILYTENQITTMLTSKQIII